MKDWPYAMLTKNAAQHGGVEAYCNDLRHEGFVAGKEKGVLEGLGIAGVFSLACLTIRKIYLDYKKEKESSIKRAEMAETALKEYLEQTENSTPENNTKEKEARNETDEKYKE